MVLVNSIAETEEEIIEAIENHIESQGDDFSEWYVGITSDPDTRLFDQHDVLKKNSDDWIVCVAKNSNIARKAEEHFTKWDITDGGGGGGNSRSRFVYAYKMHWYTKK